MVAGVEYSDDAIIDRTPVMRGAGRDHPEAACPAGGRAAVGVAGGFNAVWKLLTTTSA